MKVDDKTLNRVRELLNELSEFEEALDIIKNDNAESYFYFVSFHDNCKKEVKISMNSSFKTAVVCDIERRIIKTKYDLEKI